MDAKNILLDNAKKACSVNSDAALAVRLQVSAQQVSRWRKGHDPMPLEQIARIAKLAHVDAGDWLVLVEAEQEHGEARKAFANLAKRLSIAAILASFAQVLIVPAYFVITPGMSIMSAVTLVTLLICQDWHGSCQRRKSAHDYLLAL